MSVILRKRNTWGFAAKCSSFHSVQRGFARSCWNDDDSEGPHQKVALVLGSSGALGSAVVRHLGKDLDMRVVGADVVGLPEGSSSYLDAFIELPTFSQPAAIADVTAALIGGLSEVLDEEGGIDAIICASGGWMGDPPLPKPDATDEDFMKGVQEYGDTINKMLEMNLYPVLAAGYAANRFMTDEGLFVAIGATPALSATPGMLAYGLSKVATHHFVQTLGETTGKAMMPRKGRQKARHLRKNSEYLETLSAVGILPTTIDTPSNRKAMPAANFDEWTKAIDIAKEIGFWVETPQLRPHSGSLVKVHPAKGGGAMFTLVR